MTSVRLSQIVLFSVVFKSSLYIAFVGLVRSVTVVIKVGFDGTPYIGGEKLECDTWRALLPAAVVIVRGPHLGCSEGSFT